MAEKDTTHDATDVSQGDSKTIRHSSHNSGGRDIAAHLADQFANEPDYDRQEEVKLRWKVDFRLIPFLWLNITLPAMDKITPSTGALYGMREDLGLKGDHLGICFGVSHPRRSSNDSRLRSPCALEAPVAPGNFIIMTMWYTREEQPIRAGLFYTGLATIITGTLGWAVGFLPTHAWPSFFYITGAISILYGALVGVFLPDNPVRAKFITPRERFVAVERLRADQLGIENKTFSPPQLRETLRDPKTWLMFLFNIWVSIPNGGLTNFAPLIVNGLGYSPQRSTLLMMPTGVVQTLSSYVCNFGVANTAGHTKKVTTNAIVFASYCISNIIGPQFFKSSQAPLYPLGMGAMLVSYALSIFTMILYMLYCWNENRQREKLDQDAGRRVHLDTDFQDLTDRENIHFRYVW
ncbi:putative transporter [Colletotrichum sp. SAR11_57]|nr:putative transporter [Colletotrichum sp. SAR11_57]